MGKKKEVMAFDKTAAYNGTIKPLIDELTKQCLLNAMPMFVTVGIRGDENAVTYVSAGNHLDMPCTEYVSAMNDVRYSGLTYADNLVGRHLLVQAGCVPVPKSLVPIKDVDGKIFDEDDAETDEDI